jgi:DNA-binding HxlR family transcriptional regulator
MPSKLMLSGKLQRLVESRMKNTLTGIEETLQHILEHQEASLEELKGTVESLEASFNLLSQKWNLQILYTLFLRDILGFSEIKKILGVNSRTLSDKLKSLKHYGYTKRFVEQGPPLRVRYSLTKRGRNTMLLALPLLYYSNSSFT